MANDSVARSLAIAALSSGGGGSGEVTSVNGKKGAVVLNANDVHALPNTTVIPTKTSDLTNDSGYIDETALEGYALEEDIPTKTSDLTNDSGFIDNTYHDSTKQDTLTAGTNITIQNNVISATGGGSEPSAYIKSASVSNNTLTLTNKDNTTVEFTPQGGGSSYTAGDLINIDNNEISVDRVQAEESLNVAGSHQLISNDGQLVEGTFIARTTAGDASITSGSANHIYWRGNSQNPTYQEEEFETEAEVDRQVFISAVSGVSGTYEFIKENDIWKLNDVEVDLNDYGITDNGEESITVSYTAFNAGHIINATPTQFISTKFNQYDNTTGKAFVIEGNRYQIFGTYTSVGSETIDINYPINAFVIPYSFVASTTGWIDVVGGSTDTMIALVWSGYNYNHEYEEYEEDTISFTDITGWGMPRVNGVYDEIDFERQKYIKRIGRDVVANADLYDNKIIDDTYVYYVLPQAVEQSISMTYDYYADDFGQERFLGTDAPVSVVVLYGSNLKDKLRTDVVTLSAQTLTESQQMQVRNNLGLPYTTHIPTTFIDNNRLQSTTIAAGKNCSWWLSSTVYNEFAIAGNRFSITVANESSNPTATETIECEVVKNDGYKILTDTTNYEWFAVNTSKIGMNSSSIVLMKRDTASSLVWGEYVYVTVVYDKIVYSNKLKKDFIDMATVTSLKDGTGLYSTITADTAFDGKITASGRNSLIRASGNGDYYYGQAKATGDCSTIIGKLDNNSPTASGAGSLIGGWYYGSGKQIKAEGLGSLIWGYSISDSSEMRATSEGSVAIGNAVISDGKHCVAIGKYNISVPVWSSSSTYNQGDMVRRQNGEWRWFKSKVDNNRNNYPPNGSTDNDYWEFISEGYDYSFIIGNGTADNARSNALTVDWSGNGKFAGTVTATNIPAPPSADGEYDLHCSIVDGAITYSWTARS